MSNLLAGTYHIEAKGPVRGWYVKSVTIGGGKRNPRPTGSNEPAQPRPAYSGIAIKSGDEVNDVTVRIAEGGAELRGRVDPPEKGASLPFGLQVHLVPSESASAADPLRYLQSSISQDATFRIEDIPPGQYRAIIMPSPSPTEIYSLIRPLAWDEEGRKVLKRMAANAGVNIELKPCEVIDGFNIRYQPAATPNSARLTAARSEQASAGASR